MDLISNSRLARRGSGSLTTDRDVRLSASPAVFASRWLRFSSKTTTWHTGRSARRSAHCQLSSRYTTPRTEPTMAAPIWT